MGSPKEPLGSKCVKCSGEVCFPNIGVEDPLPPAEKAPPYCPMRQLSKLMGNIVSEYNRPEVREFARLASIQEAECYELTAEGIRNTIPRLEETIQFAGKCNYRKIGMAFCVGLKEEARMITDIFSAKGFEMVSVNCKVGGVPKESIGLDPTEKILPPNRMETMCNPIAQAEVLNAEQVDLAIMLGLCVGHDTLFLRYISVPCTVLAVKDRVLGHNPLAAAYLSKGPYYSRMRIESDKTGKGEKVGLPGRTRG
jgi:uncharacterized metal-binding protein